MEQRDIIWVVLDWVAAMADYLGEGPHESLGEAYGGVYQALGLLLLSPEGGNSSWDRVESEVRALEALSPEDGFLLRVVLKAVRERLERDESDGVVG